MPTHAELASKLLTDAATFFLTLASQNRNIEIQMTDNANEFEKNSVLVVRQPYGKLDGKPLAVVARELL